MKKIGVVLPVYNEADYLPETLTSLAQQTEKSHFFVVVVDNGSTDKSRQVIQRFSRKNPGMKMVVVDEKRRGARFARQTGFEKAITLGADILLSVDADTVYPKTMIEEVRAKYDKGADTLLLGSAIFSPHTRLLQHVYCKEFMKLTVLLKKKEFEIFGPAAQAGYFAMSSSLYSRLWWDDIARPLVWVEGPMISRRLYFGGATVQSGLTEAITSDRRFLADFSGWAKGERKKIFRKQGEVDFRKLLKQYNYPAFRQKKIEATADRWLRQFVDLLLIDSIGCGEKKRCKAIARRFMKQFELPEAVIREVLPAERFLYYNHLRHRYFSKIVKVLADLEKKSNVTNKK